VRFINGAQDNRFQQKSYTIETAGWESVAIQ
jgi:hypothetical protein